MRKQKTSGDIDDVAQRYKLFISGAHLQTNKANLMHVRAACLNEQCAHSHRMSKEADSTGEKKKKKSRLLILQQVIKQQTDKIDNLSTTGSESAPEWAKQSAAAKCS